MTRNYAVPNSIGEIPTSLCPPSGRSLLVNIAGNTDLGCYPSCLADNNNNDLGSLQNCDDTLPTAGNGCTLSEKMFISKKTNAVIIVA